MTRSALIDEFRKLPRHEQAELLDELISIVGTDEEDVVLTPAQRRDLDMRIAEYEAGNAKMLPGDEVVARLRQKT